MRETSVRTSGAKGGAARPGGVVPGEAGQRVPVERGVEAVVDPRVLLPDQDLKPHKRRTFNAVTEGDDLAWAAASDHDDQGHVRGPQSLEGLRPVSRPPVVEGGSCHAEPARRVDGQVPVDEVLVPFVLQH